MPNPLCHFELMTNDPEKCKEFYGNLFAWKFDDDSMPGYTLVDAGAVPSGGIFPKPAEAPAVCANLYFGVDDIDETLAKVTELGGAVIVPKTSIPKVGEFAMFTDPEGIAIGILKSAGH